ncbi:CU044_5270 family protein [Nonomuraea sp. LPB2021202275-12-8]|uniref:CU044_5270 family protein n=1 Tax=Nonomuraea sp. LPB2021202275-12-8 TaxID=3120159 RepID=UPI00300CD303
MNDLHEIRTLLAKPDPSPDVVARRRQELRRSMRRRTPRLGLRWVLLPAAAAAVAAALVIVPGYVGNSPSDSGAREVLLVAATTAERAPEGSGTYWHVTITRKGAPQQEYWYKKNGQFWLKGKGLKGEGKLTQFPVEPQPFAIGPLRMTFEMLRHLPTDEGGLYEKLKSAVADGDLRTSAGQLTDEQQEGATMATLLSLISEAPVSPEVRAAAYRVLAARADVQDLGEADGGRRLQVPVLNGQETLIIDPETGQLRNTSIWAPLTGGIAHSAAPATIATEWTDHLPD